MTNYKTHTKFGLIIKCTCTLISNLRVSWRSLARLRKREGRKRGPIKENGRDLQKDRDIKRGVSKPL